ncbi:hypothetical protein [Isoptericola aurantiacus]|uniref:hypothetical protein n=1 Tax=Isoptericola aurantiacus TaxID=3377839 RepID=UPI00383B805A
MLLAAAGCDGPAEELDLSHTYSSLPEVREASSAAVLFTTTSDGQRTEGERDLPFTVTTAVVVATDGRDDLDPGEKIDIRQMEGRFTNIAPALDLDESYVAYLKPWTSSVPDNIDGEGQLVIVGGQSVWRVQGSTGRRTTPDSQLPDRVTVASVDGLLSVTAS